MNRKCPRVCAVYVDPGSIRARRELAVVLRRGRDGTDMQGGGSAQAPAEKQHASSGEPNIIQWDLSFGRLDRCSREEKGGRVLPVYQTLLLAFTHIILVPSNPHSNIMRHLL